VRLGLERKINEEGVLRAGRACGHKQAGGAGGAVTSFRSYSSSWTRRTPSPT